MVKKKVYKGAAKDLSKRIGSKKFGEKFDDRHPLIAKKIDKSLDLSIKEGSFSAVNTGFGPSYFTPYALAVNATSSQIGILHALTSFLPSLVQLFSAKWIKKYSRKKIVIWAVALMTLMLIPLIVSGFLFLKGYSVVVAVIAFMTLFHGIGAIASPAWFSWMGSLVPESDRGKYFSRRNRITGFFGLISMLLGAVILDYFKGASWMGYAGWGIIGFGLLFTFAFFARIITLIYFSKQYEPTLKVRKKDYFSFWQFLKRAPETPFGRFSIYTTFFRMAANIAGPFWAVYMLSDLGFPYLWFMAVTISGTLFQLIFYPVLGKFSDRFGNVLLLKVASFTLFFSPIFWIISPYLGLSKFWLWIYLIIVPHIFAGFAWAGYNLAANNYIYDSVKQEKRSFGVTYYNLLNGIGLFVGASIGSALVLIDFGFANTLIVIFGISAIARILVFLIGRNYLREVRHVGRFTKQFIVREFRPMQGIVREVHTLNNIGGKLLHKI